MIQFTRRAALRDDALIPRAKGLAVELDRYLEKKHKIRVRVGVREFGFSSMIWFFDAPNFEMVQDINDQLSKDRDYWEMIDKNRDLWAPGAMKDGMVNFIHRDP